MITWGVRFGTASDQYETSRSALTFHPP